MKISLSYCVTIIVYIFLSSSVTKARLNKGVTAKEALSSDELR